MIVMKFGGTSVGSPLMMRRIGRIVGSRMRERPVVVVSALSGVTDSLIGIAKKRSGSRELDRVIKRHYRMISELKLSPDIISQEVKLLKDAVAGLASVDEATPRMMDKMVSFGERLSARILAGHLASCGLKAKAYDSYDLGLVTNSDFGDADVLPEAYSRIKRSFGRIAGLAVVTGFIGKDREGSITTLGRGGSDYTASIIGAAIGAREIQIWTDVNGIMTADPKLVIGARSIDAVSYEEASELAFLGAKVLHPKTILPAIDRNIRVRILNTFNPRHRGTVVLHKAKAGKRVASITCRKKVEIINIYTPRMFLAKGFLRKVFEIFERHKLSVDMVSTSEVTVSVTLNNSGNGNMAKAVGEIRRFAQVELKSNRAKIALVGNDIVHIPGIFRRVFSAMGSITIEMISSSDYEINQSLVVRERDADLAVMRLHREFFGR